MEIVEHLVMDDLVVGGGDLYVTEHLVVSSEIAGVESLGCIHGDLHISFDMEFVVVGVDSLVVDVDEDLSLKHYVKSILRCEHSN